MGAPPNFVFVRRAQKFVEFVESMDEKHVGLAFNDIYLGQWISYIHHKYCWWKKENPNGLLWGFLAGLDPGNTRILANYAMQQVNTTDYYDCQSYCDVLKFFEMFYSSNLSKTWYLVFKNPKSVMHACWIQFCRFIPRSANGFMQHEKETKMTKTKRKTNNPKKPRTYAKALKANDLPYNLFDCEPLVNIIYGYSQPNSETEFFYTRLTRQQQEKAFNLMCKEWYVEAPST